jgi:galactokinase
MLALPSRPIPNSVPIHPRPSSSAFAPGRVNLIGEHTDYNGGLALPFAITEGVTVRAMATGDPRVLATALDLGEEDSFDLAAPAREADGWRAFARGVVAELGRAGIPLVGARLEIEGTVAQGAGLSSSAALEVALALALIGLTGAEPPDGTTLAEICSRAENEWAGARTGLLDQLASLLGEADAALCIDFRSLEVEVVPLAMGDWRLVTLDSGERHANASSGYNERRDQCARAAELLGLASLREATEAMLPELPEPLSDRVRHVIGENGRVEGTVDALRRGDLAEVGRLLDASHASLRDLYAVSTPAVEAAVDALRAAGAAGARVVGGGFGGHVIGLFPPDAAPPDGAHEVRPGAGARLTNAA